MQTELARADRALFTDHQDDNTTIEQIAVAAGMSGASSSSANIG